MVGFILTMGVSPSPGIPDSLPAFRIVVSLSLGARHRTGIEFVHQGQDDPSAAAPFRGIVHRIGLIRLGLASDRRLQSLTAETRGSYNKRTRPSSFYSQAPVCRELNDVNSD